VTQRQDPEALNPKAMNDLMISYSFYKALTDQVISITLQKTNKF